jgi:hypothetical protein
MKNFLNFTLASIGILTQYNEILIASIIILTLINVNNFVDKYIKIK